MVANDLDRFTTPQIFRWATLAGVSPGICWMMTGVKIYLLVVSLSALWFVLRWLLHRGR